MEEEELEKLKERELLEMNKELNFVRYLVKLSMYVFLFMLLVSFIHSILKVGYGA